MDVQVGVADVTLILVFGVGEVLLSLTFAQSPLSIKLIILSNLCKMESIKDFRFSKLYKITKSDKHSRF